MSIGCYHHLPRAAWQSYKFTSLFTKHRQLERQVGDSHALSIVEKEVMAPCTYIRLALGTAPGGRIHFGSLEFADDDGLAPVNSLLPSQALCFRDLDFVVDHLGQLRLGEGNAAPSHIPTPDHGPAHADTAIVDSNAHTCRIDAYFGMNPKPGLSRRIFYVLVNSFT